MGQYGNQPDFGTEAAVVVPIADAAIPSTTKLGGACLYVGVAGDIKVILRGVVGAAGSGPPTAAQGIVFKGVPAGSILPVIVDYVLATGTTATDMIALK
jgi:hypothetical protein